MFSFRKSQLIWLLILGLIALLDLVISVSFETRSATQAAHRYLQIWETEIARATLMGEKSESIDKIYRQIEEFHPSLRLLKPNEDLHLCSWPVTQQISLYSLPAAQITVCREPWVLVQGGLISPVFFSFLSVVMLLILFALQRDHKSEIQRLAAEARAESEAQVAKISKQVAHDIRGPLSALHIFSQNIPALNTEQKTFLMEISERIHQIAEDLLRRTAQVSAPAVVSIFEVDSALESLIREQRLRFPRAQLKLDLKSKAQIRSDRSAFLRAIANLIQNAMEAGGAESEVTVSSRHQGDGVLIAIDDRGPGLSEQELEKIIQGRQSTTKVQGYGLGLSFVQSYMAGSQGQLRIRSKLGQGFRVELHFPV